MPTRNMKSILLELFIGICDEGIKREEIGALMLKGHITALVIHQANDKCLFQNDV